MDLDRRNRHGSTSEAAREHVSTPGKTTLAQTLPPAGPNAPAPVPTGTAAASSESLPPTSSGPRPTLQMLFGDRRARRSEPDPVHAAAARGTATAATQLPHLEPIQRSFGRHDVSRVQAHVGADAAASARDMGAVGYATGNHVVLGDNASLHTEAHEAAHIVQQRSGVSLKGGVGEVGDAYERHADAVADAVVRGESAEHLLDSMAGAGSTHGGASGAGVQRVLTADGVDTTTKLSKQIAAYNAQLATVATARGARVPKNEIDALVRQLNTINASLVTPLRGLSPEQQQALKAQGTRELEAVRAASSPRDLRRLLGAAGPAVAQSDAGPADAEAASASADVAPSVGEDPAPPATVDVPGGASISASGSHGDPASSSVVAGHGDASESAAVSHGEGAAVEEASDDAPAAPLGARTPTENRTRIGFEIEPGGHYVGPAAARDVVARYVNQTLLTYTSDSKPLLEMLLDDPRVVGQRLILQVEFRTPPLGISDISTKTATQVRNAIRGLKAKNVFHKGGALGVDGWTRSRACDALIDEVGTGQLTTDGGFQAPGALAQHVTSSINLGAYPALKPAHQKALYAKGVGSKTRVELYQNMLRALTTDDGMTIDASTRGRNNAAVTAKSSIEALLAAEQALAVEGAGEVLGAMTSATRPTHVSVGGDPSDKHAISSDLPGSVAAIQDHGAYPAMQGEASPQGEASAGYLAVAEKMQPPLLDTRNHQLRVLIEHRTDALRDAVNQVLSGRQSPVWDEFVQAVAAMDRAR